MPNEWVNNGDVNFAEYGGNLTRLSEHDPHIVEVFRLETPWVTGDGYRAFSFQLDLDDFDRPTLQPVLQSCGYVSANGNHPYLRQPGDPTLAIALTDSSWARTIESIGPHRLADMVVCYYGASWCDWATFHDWDDGYAGPGPHQAGGLKPWGSLTASEVCLWMSNLGCGAFAPYTSVYERLPEGVILGDGNAPEHQASFYAVTAFVVMPSEDAVCHLGPMRLEEASYGAWKDWSPTFDTEAAAMAWAEAYRDGRATSDRLGLRDDISSLDLLIVRCDVDAAVDSLRAESWAWADAGDICDAIAPVVVSRVPVPLPHAERVPAR